MFSTSFILVMPGQSAIVCQRCQTQIPIQICGQPVSGPKISPPVNPIPQPFPPIFSAPSAPLNATSPTSEHEQSWRSKFPRKFSLILGIVQFVFIVLIVILEIAALGVAPTWRPTGVGIWSAIVFSIAAAMKIKLGRSSTRFRLPIPRCVCRFCMGTIALMGNSSSYC